MAVFSDDGRAVQAFYPRIYGTWTFEFVPDGGGTRLTITERGEVYNPNFRFMSRFVFGHTATMDAFFESLGKRVGESPT
jgi:hypothetical protein